MRESKYLVWWSYDNENGKRIRDWKFVNNVETLSQFIKELCLEENETATIEFIDVNNVIPAQKYEELYKKYSVMANACGGNVNIITHSPFEEDKYLSCFDRMRSLY